MKCTKTIGALAVALGVATAAQAQTNVFITGSTAFRAQIFNALADLGLSVQQSGVSGNNSFTFSGVIHDATGAGHSAGTSLNLGVVAPGLTNSTGTVNVYCTFSGSAEGVDAVINQPTISFLNVGAAGAGSLNSSVIDLAFSDVAQYSTPDANNADQLNEVQLASDANLHNGNPGTGIAVQPFVFCVNSNANTISNITQVNFDQLYVGAGNGELPICMFNGSTNTNVVRAIGRYALSGTRITSILDDQYLLSDSISQWALEIPSTNGYPTNFPGLASTDGSSPPNTNTMSWGFVTNDGYFSGGNVGKAIDFSSVQGLPAAIGYIGMSDASGKLNYANGDRIANWEGQNPGVTNNWNISSVLNGGYTVWSYERLYCSDADAGTWYQTTFGAGLVDAVQYEIVNSVPQTATVESLMNVYRSSDGTQVTHY